MRSLTQFSSINLCNNHRFCQPQYPSISPELSPQSPPRSPVLPIPLLGTSIQFIAILKDTISGVTSHVLPKLSSKAIIDFRTRKDAPSILTHKLHNPLPKYRISHYISPLPIFQDLDSKVSLQKCLLNIHF